MSSKASSVNTPRDIARQAVLAQVAAARASEPLVRVRVVRVVVQDLRAPVGREKVRIKEYDRTGRLVAAYMDGNTRTELAQRRYVSPRWWGQDTPGATETTFVLNPAGIVR